MSKNDEREDNSTGLADSNGAFTMRNAKRVTPFVVEWGSDSQAEIIEKLEKENEQLRQKLSLEENRIKEISRIILMI